ncbi:MAG TPA: amino acid permease, partial [Candidatus Dormibacteraeota bacterium]|nr:amino acid permease [Candidatus Dormibacteraeota bacterium]
MAGSGKMLFTRQSSGLVREVSVTNALFFNTSAFIVGLLCVLLAVIFASLTTVMPRSGGDYVFSSRIVPRVGPLLGWLESWGLVFASIALLQFETVQTLRSTQVEGRIIGIGTNIDFFNNANGWFTDGSSGDVTGVPGLLAALVVFAFVGWVVLQPTRTFHKIVTYLTVLGIVGWALMAVFGLIF